MLRHEVRVVCHLCQAAERHLAESVRCVRVWRNGDRPSALSLPAIIVRKLVSALCLAPERERKRQVFGQQARKLKQGLRAPCFQLQLQLLDRLATSSTGDFPTVETQLDPVLIARPDAARSFDGRRENRFEEITAAIQDPSGGGCGQSGRIRAAESNLGFPFVSGKWIGPL